VVSVDYTGDAAVASEDRRGVEDREQNLHGTKPVVTPSRELCDSSATM
jgi:hypothetical protein